jgi:TolB-like protein
VQQTDAALYRFGTLAFDAERGRVIRGDASAVELRPKTAEVALHLIENAGQVVTREALMGAVWRDVFVTDDSITQCIGEIRRALGEDGAAILRTLPRRGYLLEAAVRREAGAPRPQAPAVPRPPVTPRPDDRPSIVVLPFQAPSGDGQDGWFAAGVIEGIVHVLCGLDDLFVISQASSQAMGPGEDVARIGEALGVRYVLRGSVWRADGRLRLTATLVEAESGRVLRAEKLDGAPGDLFGMQDRIAAQVVAAIAPTVRSHELQRAMRKPPESLTAYDCVLRALHLMPRLEEAAYAQAGDLLREAVATDPGYAPGWGYLAYWHLLGIGQGWSRDLSADNEAAARCSAAALECDANYALALAIRGHMLSFLNRDYLAAAAVLDHALEAGPNCALAWSFASATSGYLGDGPTAVLRAEQAMRLSPRDPFLFRHEHMLSQAHYIAGDHEAAVAGGEQSARRVAGLTSNLRTLTAALVALGQMERARAVAAQLMAVEPGFRIGPWSQRTPLCGALLETFVARLRQAGLPG